uniref:Uncharacterized protein n=1 Tax=Glossina brevipalpis TaxID=37001 RepID=A0A1A9X4B2_9MUSC
MPLNSEIKLHLSSLYVRPAHIYWHTLLWGCYWILFICSAIQAEISRTSDNFDSLLNHFNDSQCTSRKFDSLAKVIDDIEYLQLDVPMNIAFDNRQRKRRLYYNGKLWEIVTFDKICTLSPG